MGQKCIRPKSDGFGPASGSVSTDGCARSGAASTLPPLPVTSGICCFLQDRRESKIYKSSASVGIPPCLLRLPSLTDWARTDRRKFPTRSPIGRGRPLPPPFRALIPMRRAPVRSGRHPSPAHAGRSVALRRGERFPIRTRGINLAGPDYWARPTPTAGFS